MSKLHKVKAEALTSSDYEIKSPRIVSFDIECYPHIAAVWGHWQQNVIWYEKKGYLLSIAWKWLGEKKTHIISLPQYEGYTDSDSTERQMLEDLWNVLDEADIVIAHNGQSFDVKMVNQRFIKHKMRPPSYYRIVDTKVEAKRISRSSSNSLDHLCEEYELGRKLKHQGSDLWKQCGRGESKAWKVMEKYNKNDVVMLEKLYLELRPWMDSHPNLNVLMRRDTGCSKCGSTHLTKRGVRWTNMSVAQRYQCKDCGGYTQGKYTKTSTQRSG